MEFLKPLDFLAIHEGTDFRASVFNAREPLLIQNRAVVRRNAGTTKLQMAAAGTSNAEFGVLDFNFASFFGTRGDNQPNIHGKPPKRGEKPPESVNNNPLCVILHHFP